MPSPAETVEAFLARIGEPGGFVSAVRDWFTPETVYENIGINRTVGIEDNVAFAEQFIASSGSVAIRIETLVAAVTGNRVLTERIDNLVNAAGETTMAIRVMGIFAVEDGKITEWRDYFDTVPFNQ
ncbi:MAG TPA: limonene-1,2-epoxide hydrolase family protein [Novosphingobium sp.]|nr:limonene-1,2-epoxide hydrolase family protein [Novosphingobium sp.]